MHLLEWYFFSCEAAKEFILILDKMIKKARILVNGCFVYRSDADSSNQILTSVPYRLWCLAYGPLVIN